MMCLMGWSFTRSSGGQYDRAERDLAQEHLIALGRLTPSDTPNLVLFDRGYPSADLILWLFAHHIRFVMRVSQGFYSEISAVTESDAVVTIRITPGRLRRGRRPGRGQRAPAPISSDLQYREYRINRNVLGGTIKNRLIQALLEPDGAQRDQVFQRNRCGPLGPIP